MSAPGRVVLLDGPSSSGKSSIARALQERLPTPWIHASMDAFIAMLPPRYVGEGRDAREGFLFERMPDDMIAITNGAAATRLLAGMHRSFAALAHAGSDVIVDHVCVHEEPARDLENALEGLRVLRVAVKCALDVLEARERARADRLVGMARWQAPRMHRFFDYDLVVDASVDSASRIAETIASAIV